MEENKVKTTEASIDKDVLDIMKDEDVLKAVSDDKLTKRLILNCFCEFLSQIKGLRKDIDDFSQMISVLSADKLGSFFKELQKNVDAEEKRLKVQEKISQSHKKPKNSKKNAKK